MEETYTDNYANIISDDVVMSSSSGYTVDNIICGDVNSDFRINSTDYAAMKKHILGTIELTGKALEAGDVDGYGFEINSTDYAYMKRFILRIIHEFPRDAATTNNFSTTMYYTPATIERLTAIQTAEDEFNAITQYEWDNNRIRILANLAQIGAISLGAWIVLPDAGNMLEHYLDCTGTEYSEDFLGACIITAITLK